MWKLPISEDTIHYDNEDMANSMVAELIRAFIKKTLNWNQELNIQANAGNLDGVKHAVEQGAQVKFAHDFPLKNACFNGHYEVAEYLLDLGQGVKIREELLCEVIERGNLEILKLLVEHGANITSGYKKALKFVRLACQNRHVEVARFLLEKGANIHNYKNTYLLQEASRAGYKDIVKLLVDFGADINTRNCRALMEAIWQGHLDVVVCLVENGADFRSNEDWALRMASRNRHFQIRDYLVSQGADPQNIINNDSSYEEAREWAIAFVKARDLANKLRSELQNKQEEKAVVKKTKI